MSNLKELQKARDDGFDVPDRELRLAKRQEARDNRPEPVRPDPIHNLIENMTAELKKVSYEASANQLTIISKVMEGLNNLAESLKDLKPEPKKKKLEVMDSGGKLKYTINVKEV